MTRTITNKLLWINLFLILVLIVIAIFWTEIGLTDSKNIYLGLTAVIVYGFSVAGVFVGIIERKNKKDNTSLGIIGNSILTTIFLVLFVYSTLIMDM